MKIQPHSSTIFSFRNITPLPKKKRVGRPTKLYISDQVRNVIAKYLDFHEMVDFSKKYDQLFEIRCKSYQNLEMLYPKEERSKVKLFH